MADRKTRVVVSDLSGGINTYDPPWAIADNECVDAINVDWYKSPLGRKRGGLAASGLTGTNFAGGEAIVQLFRHVPGTDDTAAELWATNNQATPKILRLAAGTVFAQPTLKDAPTGNGYDFTFASINGKLFIAYLSAVDRLHVWDGSTVRRAGLAATVAPTAANGGGAGVASLRYYRQRSTRQSGGVTLGRSEPSPSVSFTPGANGVTVTQAAVINEGETHWEVEGSVDNVTFYRIATVVIGTATYLDNADPATYNTNPLSALTGFYTLQKSYKFIAADENRLLGFGNWTATNKQARIEYSAVIGSSDVSDEERVDTTTNSYNDLDERDSGVPTGLRGPVDSSYFAFKEKQTWEGVPTGSVAQPFRWDPLDKTVGCVAQVSAERGSDKDGHPALFWKSHRGPYMWTKANGMRYLGRNIEAYILGPTATINLAATVVARTLYIPDKRQVWFWWATGASGTPNVCFFYDCTTGGWSRVGPGDGFTGLDTASAAVMFSNTPGASMSKDLKPYIGWQIVTGGSIVKADTGTTDSSISFQATIITKAFEPGGPGAYGEVGDAELLAAAATGVTITAVTVADFGEQTAVGAAVLTPSGGVTYLSKRLEGSALTGDVRFIQYTVGDVSATTAAWNLGRLVIPMTARGQASQ